MKDILACTIMTLGTVNLGLFLGMRPLDYSYLVFGLMGLAGGFIHFITQNILARYYKEKDDE